MKLKTAPNGQWSTVYSPIPAGEVTRSESSTVAIYGKILIAGGSVVNDVGELSFTDRIDVYNPETDSWSLLTPLSQPRMKMTAAVVGTKVIFAGGVCASETANSSVVDIYDFTNPEFPTQSTTTLPGAARSSMASAVVGHKAIFAGGIDYVGAGEHACWNDVVVYDIYSETWTPIASMSSVRSFFASAVVGSKVFFAGGYTGSTSFSDTMDIYDFSDLAAPELLSTKTLSVGRAYLAAAAPATGNLLFIGGGFYQNNAEVDWAHYIDAVDVFDIDADVFLPNIPPLSVPRCFLTAVSYENYVIFAGGTSEASRVSTVDIYDSRDLAELPTTMELPSGGNSNHTSALIGDIAYFPSQIHTMDIFQFISSEEGLNYYLATSPDGLVWDAVETPEISSLCWSPKLHLFCAVGEGLDDLALIRTSSEGKTWTSSTQRIERPLGSVCWAPELGKFCALSSVPVLSLTSTDGMSWIESGPISQDLFDDAVYGCQLCWSSELKLFCAVLQGTVTKIMTSTDGLIWTPRYADEDGANSYVSVCWSPELCMFCVVMNSLDSADSILTSSDGVTWDMPTTPVVDSGLSLTLVRWSSGLRLFYVSGVDSLSPEDPKAVLLTSEDGKTWKYNPTRVFRIFDMCWSPSLHTFCSVGLRWSDY